MRRELLALAWPIATAMLGDVAMGLVDTRLVGGLGAQALAGVGIAATLLFVLYSFASGLMRGVKVCGSHAVGLQRSGDALVYARAGALAGAAVGAAVWLLGRNAGWALSALGVEPGPAEAARAFLAARTWGAPALCVLHAMVQYRQSLGDTRSPMAVGIAGNVVNALLAWALIYGRAGLPQLGVAGAGYGTAATEWLQVLALGALYVRDAARAQREGNSSTLATWSALREVAAVGLPTGLQFCLEMLAFTAFTAALGTVGAAEVAGHQVAMATIRVSFLPGFAVADAASILVGRALGRRDLSAADRAVGAGISIAVAFMTACGLLFATLGNGIAHLLAPDDAVAAVTRRLLLVAAVFQALDAVTMALRSALRAAKDVRVPPAIGVCVTWLCVPTAAVLLGRHAGLGALGGWLGFVGETTLSATLFWWRWRAGSWRAAYAAGAELPRTDPRQIATAVAT